MHDCWRWSSNQTRGLTCTFLLRCILNLLNRTEGSNRRRHKSCKMEDKPSQDLDGCAQAGSLQSRLFSEPSINQQMRYLWHPVTEFDFRRKSWFLSKLDTWEKVAWPTGQNDFSALWILYLQRWFDGVCPWTMTAFRVVSHSSRASHGFKAFWCQVVPSSEVYLFHTRGATSFGQFRSGSATTMFMVLITGFFANSQFN